MTDKRAPKPPPVGAESGVTAPTATVAINQPSLHDELERLGLARVVKAAEALIHEVDHGIGDCIEQEEELRQSVHALETEAKMAVWGMWTAADLARAEAKAEELAVLFGEESS